MKQEEFEQRMLEEMEDNQLDEEEDHLDDQEFNKDEWQEAYGVPDADEKHNQHTFLSKSLDVADKEKVTYLNVSELGRPLFNLRFLLDIEDISKYYLDELCKEYNAENKIAQYFREKINNVCSSGMSNEGFIQNLNVSKKIEATRHRIKNLNPELNKKMK